MKKTRSKKSRDTVPLRCGLKYIYVIYGIAMSDKSLQICSIHREINTQMITDLCCLKFPRFLEATVHVEVCATCSPTCPVLHHMQPDRSPVLRPVFDCCPACIFFLLH
jgi:hypothetical protein